MSTWDGPSCTAHRRVGCRQMAVASFTAIIPGHSTQPDCDLIGLGYRPWGESGLLTKNAKTLEENSVNAWNSRTFPSGAGPGPDDDLLRRANTAGLDVPGGLLALTNPLPDRFLKTITSPLGNGISVGVCRARRGHHDGSGLQITETGWLVRAVAMVFDRYLQLTAPEPSSPRSSSIAGCRLLRGNRRTLMASGSPHCHVWRGVRRHWSGGRSPQNRLFPVFN
jgi:hypothetical protein